jgi:alginate O-acetyltransferase complex protein AlgI
LVFSSLLFLYLFLPIVFIAYFSFRNTTYRNWVIILSSFAFYAWGEPVWIVLLACAAVLGYVFALLVDKFRADWRGKAFLIVAICVNVAILGFFKYAGFIVDNLNQLLHLDIPRPSISLPIGVSFFTFEMICYTADVYRGVLGATRNLTHMLLYTSFFPHLIAGPIIRFVDIRQQMDDRRVTIPSFSEGINRFMIGLGKKVIIANQIGESVPMLLEGRGGPASVLGAWYGISLFALQIYFDYSGYTDMAIGLAKMFGFTLKENFNYPYIANSARDFWRRWNMSLSGFFRDYVYIPLGGNRRNLVRNLFVVWFLTGFWHGASWNFVLWGLYFGLLILVERLFLARLLEAIPGSFSHVYMTLAMLVGWVFFYFTDLHEAVRCLQILFGLGGRPLSSAELVLYFNQNMFLYAIAIIGSTPLAKWLFSRMAEQPVLTRLRWENVMVPLYNFGVFSVSTILLVGGTYNPFLYFRF